MPEMAESLWAPGRMMTSTMFEDEAYRRVVEGVPRPIYKQGVQIGERRVKSERLLKFLLVANVPEKYGKRDLPPIRPEDEPGRKEFTEKHNAMVREDAELNRAFEDWVLCNSAQRNHRAPPCTQGRECSIYGCGGKGLLCNQASPGGNAESKKQKAEMGQASARTREEMAELPESGLEEGEQGAQGEESGGKAESGKASPCTQSKGKASPGTQSKDKATLCSPSGKASRCTPFACGGKASLSTLPKGEAFICMEEETVEIPESGLEPEGQSAQEKEEKLRRRENADAPPINEMGAEAGDEGQEQRAEGAPQAEIAEVQPAQKAWKFDPYDTARRVMEADRARRIRRRQIEM